MTEVFESVACKSVDHITKKIIELITQYDSQSTAQQMTKKIIDMIY